MVQNQAINDTEEDWYSLYSQAKRFQQVTSSELPKNLRVELLIVTSSTEAIQSVLVRLEPLVGEVLLSKCQSV